MKATLSTSQAADLLKADTNAKWSHSGALALVEYLEELESDTGTEIEFDAVAIRCDFSEYDSALQAALDQGFEPNPNLGDDKQDDDDKEADALSWLQDQTQVIEFEGGVIIASFWFFPVVPASGREHREAIQLHKPNKISKMKIKKFLELAQEINKVEQKEKDIEYLNQLD